MTKKEINRLMCNHLLGMNSAEEENLLRQNVDADEMHVMEQAEGFALRYKAYANADVDKAKERMKKTLPQLPIKGEGHLSLFMKIAASLLFLIAVTAIWLYDYSRTTPPTLSPDIVEIMETKTLPSPHYKGGRFREGLRAREHFGAVVSPMTEDDIKPYMLSVSEVDDLLASNKIETSRNKEHWLTLSDGTVIHLNNNTRVIYPEKFPLFGKREIVIEGSAYVMVAHSDKRQFVVHTPQSDIIDYGTEFYIEAPSHHDATTVVLLEGSIGVKPQGTDKERKLVPGERAIIHNDGIKNVEKTDLEEYRAWNTGKFFFQDKTMAEIMQVLGRWYDLRVAFTTDEIQQKKFSGNFDRFDDVYSIMDAISSFINVEYNIYNGTITISNK